MQVQTSPTGTIPSPAPPRARHAFTPDGAVVARMPDQEIHGMDREELIALLNRVPSPCLERRVKRRLKHFDAVTLRRLLFLCRRCARNLAQLQDDRCRVPTTTF